MLPSHPVPSEGRLISVTGAGRVRWPVVRGAKMHTPDRRPKPRGPDPTARVTGIWRSLCARRQTERTAVNPKAVVKLPERRKARKPEMLCRPPGVSRSKPINTARGTLERRRTCGTERQQDGGPAGFAVPLRCREMPRPVGPSDSRRPARPRTYFDGATGRITRARMRREKENPYVQRT